MSVGTGILSWGKAFEAWCALLTSIWCRV